MPLWDTFVESGLTIMLMVNAFLFVPQIHQLYKTKNPTGLSFAMFAGFNLIQIFMVLHGVLRNDKILILGNILSLITCGTITAMILYYRIRK